MSSTRLTAGMSRFFALPLLCLSFATAAFGHGGEAFLGIDNDNNRISDLYQALYPGVTDPHADNDRDGMTNEQEAAAATDPNDPADNLNFQTVTNTGASVQAAWLTVGGKMYQMQASSDLGGTWTNEGAPVAGDGGVASATCPVGNTRMFLRIQVADVDNDADGVTDWEELQAGTDRYLFDTDEDGRSDRGLVEALTAGTNTVNIFPVNTWASEVGPRTAQFRIVRHGSFAPLTVPYSLSGTAGLGTDYTISASGSVVLPAGVNQALVTVTPLADAQLEDAETVVMTLNAGSGYTVGAVNAATITIVSQGLVGQYFNFSSGTYNFTPAAGQNFDPAQLGLTRRDANIAFNWSKPTGTPAGTGNGVPGAGITDDDVWGARWSGFVIPSTTEVYSISATADRGVVVWVSTSPITGTNTNVRRLNTWSTTNPSTPLAANTMLSSTEVSTRIMEAGRPYYIVVDYRDSATFTDNANIELRWSTPTMAETVIPGTAFSSEGFIGTPPVINSVLVTAAIAGAPFDYQITATNTPTSFSASGLPPGLTVNSTNGQITGSITGGGGYYFPTVTAANMTGSDTKNLVIYVTTTGGSITREVWTGLPGGSVLDVPLHTTPASTSTRATLEAPANDGDGYGERMRGYLTAPSTGLFTFFLTSDENAELWVSSSDEPAHKLKRSWVTAGSVAPGAWDTQPSQRSVPMMLTAGVRYYVEVIRHESTGGDHLQAGWLRPGQTGTAPSEIIPGWALTSYSQPAAATDDGFLYTALLTPQSGAASLGSGSAVLRVNEDKTAADLTVMWGNLTGPVTNSHIHDSRPAPGPAGAIIFDIDDADPDRLLPGGDGLDPNEVYHWEIVATGQHTIADVIAAIEGGTAYINLHTQAYPNGEIRGFFQPVVGTQFFVPPAAPPAAELTLPSDPIERQAEIIRFLQQATFGGRHETDGAAPYAPDTIESVEALGYAAWIDQQLALPSGTDPETLVTQMVPPRTSFAFTAPTSGSRTIRLNNPATGYNSSGPLGSFVRGWYEKWPQVSYSNVGAPLEDSNDLWRAWWRTSIQAQDQLRHRVAFALSQILVTSEDGELDELTRGMSAYYDLLYYHGLGNFRTLLEKSTLSPIMGRYLDMLNNRKPNPASGYVPNENFAREILQLFSIGLRRLHPDGSLVLSTGGLPVNTYENPNVVGFAHVFTGWVQPGAGSNYVLPMIPRASDHDTGAKLLLENAVIPATTTASTASCNSELATALDVIHHHPNTGPFICRQLIQRMVTANPSPGYIYRTARVFADNGSGVRGDLAAVVKAILLDPEARNQHHRTQPGFGHLKEPVIRATQMLRAFNGFSYGEVNYANNSNMLTTVFVSPNTNIDLTQPLPGNDYTGSSSGGTAIFPGDLIRLTGQSNTAENGYYTFNGPGTPLTPAATATPVTTYTVNVDILTGPAQVHVPLIEGVSVGVGNLILLRNQTNPAENGVYQVTALNQPVVRWAGADSGAELSNAVIRVGIYRDPVTLAYSNQRTFKVDGTVTTVGTDPVNIIDGSATQAGIQMWNMGSTGGGSFFQTPLRAPTVFNYYEPDYVFLGDSGLSGLYSPEFQITSETSVVNTANWFHELSRRNAGTVLAHTFGQGNNYGGVIGRDIKLDMTAQEALAGNSGSLVDNLALHLMPGQMTPRLRTLLTDYLNGMALTGTTTHLPMASTWKFFTDATGLSASNIVDGHPSYTNGDWKHPDYNDAAWTSGAAPLGYNTGNSNAGITTVVPFGASATNKWRTSYYRTSFTLAGAAAIPSFNLRLRRDDAAIVYVNGKEAYRTNFAAGAVITASTFADSSSDATVTATVPAANFLRDGVNVVAVEVHQASANSSDIYLDLELTTPAITAADRMNRVGEALSILSLTPEFSTQK
jgi:hypothetical protein